MSFGENNGTEKMASPLALQGRSTVHFGNLSFERQEHAPKQTLLPNDLDTRVCLDFIAKEHIGGGQSAIRFAR